VRLEVTPEMPDDVRDLLVRRLLLTEDDVHVVDGLGDGELEPAATRP
jgi:hypothetical protein